MSAEQNWRRIAGEAWPEGRLGSFQSFFEDNQYWPELLIRDPGTFHTYSRHRLLPIILFWNIILISTYIQTCIDKNFAKTDVLQVLFAIARLCTHLYCLRTSTKTPPLPSQLGDLVPAHTLLRKQGIGFQENNCHERGHEETVLRCAALRVAFLEQLDRKRTVMTKGVFILHAPPCTERQLSVWLRQTASQCKLRHVLFSIMCAWNSSQDYGLGTVSK